MPVETGVTQQQTTEKHSQNNRMTHSVYAFVKSISVVSDSPGDGHEIAGNAILAGQQRRRRPSCSFSVLGEQWHGPPSAGRIMQTT